MSGLRQLIREGVLTLPTYDYHCPANDRVVTVFHAMSQRLATWGELCDLASLDVGLTPRESPVQKQIGAGMVMTRRPDQLLGFGAGCCGTNGCGD